VTPCSLVEVYRRFGFAAYLVYSSKLKAEAICFSETSVNEWRYVPGDNTIHCDSAGRTSRFILLADILGIRSEDYIVRGKCRVFSLLSIFEIIKQANAISMLSVCWCIPP
jgi:hypothetical protein